MRLALIGAAALGVATLFATLASCSPASREGSQWQTVPDSGSVNWMRDGANMLYYADGSPGAGFRVVSNDPRCKP
jgi:hypothetical protein